MTAERQIFYEGRVQGVGFRYTVKQIAMGFEVTGWVRNLPDGRVELQVRGDPIEIRVFLEAIAASQLNQFIRRQEESETTSFDPDAVGFEIRR